MKPIRFAVLAALALCLLATTATNSLADPKAPKAPSALERLNDHVRRAIRLIEFGRPVLAKKQLDLAAAIDPLNRDVMLWQLRLHTRSTGSADDAGKWANALAKNFPDDYEACLEVAKYLFINQPDLRGPNPNSETEVKAALSRLEEEMKVYLPLADYVIEPGEKLPQAASKTSNLSLAWLARACKQSPRTGEIACMAAQELDFRAQRFASWAKLVSALVPFGDGAKQLWERAAMLYRRAFATDSADLTSRAALCGVHLRLGRFDEARKECEATLLVSGPDAPVNNRIYGILVEVAGALGDLELLLVNLERRHKVYNDVDTALHLSAARRIKASGWAFSRWHEYMLVCSLSGEARLQSSGELIAAEPKFLEVHLLAAEAMLLRADMLKDDAGARKTWLEGAVAAADRSGELLEKLADASRIKALALWHMGKFKESAESFARTAKLDADDESAARYAKAAGDIAAKLYRIEDYYELSALQRESDFKAKRSRLEALTKRAPKYFEAWLMLGEVSYLLSFFEEAADAYAAALALASENLQCLFGAAFASLNLGRFDIAKKHFDALNGLKQNYKGTERWQTIVNAAVAKGAKRQRAIIEWLKAVAPTISPAAKLEQLEKAVAADDTFSEALIDQAKLLREQSAGNERGPLLLERAERLLARAYENADDNNGRAAARLELGRVRIAMKRYDAAADDFEASYAADKGDGTALLMAALAKRAVGDEANAAGAMRKLYAEVPGTILMRPSDQVLTLLGLRNAKHQGPRHVTPAWALSDKRSFSVAIHAEGEGGEIGRHIATWSLDMHIEVASTPELSGTWKLIVTFTPGDRCPAGLENLRLQVEINPWFGLVRDPLPRDSKLANAVEPAVVALCEALCIGLGDSPIVNAYAWRNERTLGPAHFGGDNSAEAAIIENLLGDTTVVKRVAAKGRRAGGDPDYVNEGGRVEVVCEIAGDKRALRKVTTLVENEQLAASDDDVISSKLAVTMTAK